MKKTIILLSLAILTVAVTACPAPTPPVVDPTPTPVVVDPTPVPPPPTVVPPPPTVVPPPPTEVPVASWWPPRPARVPLSFVFCPVPGPGGAGEEDKWLPRSDCPYDPYIKP